MSRIITTIGTVAAAAFTLTACSRTHNAHRDHSHQIDIKVDETGFVPAHFAADSDEPLTLRVTRTTDKTCATEIVIKDEGIRRELPLGQPVDITFTPSRKGELRFACSMDMIGGTIHVD